MVGITEQRQPFCPILAMYRDHVLYLLFDMYNRNVSIIEDYHIAVYKIPLHRNSCGSTPLHLAAGTGHAAVVSYLLTHRAGQGVKAALDNEGKSPLAVCLDGKMNDWAKTAEMLRDAYNHPVSQFSTGTASSRPGFSIGTSSDPLFLSLN